MFTIILFAAALVCFLLILFVKAGLIYLVRPGPTVTYARCALLELMVLALSVAGTILILFANVAADARDALQRASRMVVIAGTELVAALLFFGVVSLFAGIIVLALAWRRHLSRAISGALIANVAMTGILVAAAILLFSPAPFLTIWQAPAERAGRSTASYPARPTLPPAASLPLMTEPTRTAKPDLTRAAQQAVMFLNSQYDARVGLLRESPSVAPHKYWLATDNLLAWHALTATGQVTLTAKLNATFAEHGRPTHGLIEILDGQIAAWPPYVEQKRRVATIDGAEIWLETRTRGDQYRDWAEYADLAFYDALLDWNRGQFGEAQRSYQDAMRLFDGVGFADKAFQTDGVYTTYKLALAMLVAQALGEPVDSSLQEAMLSKQADALGPEDYAGGFYALYDRQGQPLNDPNTETTSYALLALSQHAAH